MDHRDLSRICMREGSAEPNARELGVVAKSFVRFAHYNPTILDPPLCMIPYFDLSGDQLLQPIFLLIWRDPRQPLGCHCVVLPVVASQFAHCGCHYIINGVAIFRSISAYMYVYYTREMHSIVGASLSDSEHATVIYVAPRPNGLQASLGCTPFVAWPLSPLPILWLVNSVPYSWPLLS